MIDMKAVETLRSDMGSHKSRSFTQGVSQFDEGFVVTRRQCVRFLVTDPGGRTYLSAFSAAATCRRVDGALTA